MKNGLLLLVFFFFNAILVNAQCIEGNCFNGQGIYLARNGSKYEGGFLAGKFHGKGKSTFSNRDLYLGYYRNGKKDGVGKYIYAAGHVYVGDFKNDLRQGKGKITFANGDVYQGDWVKDSPEGTGTYLFTDGSKYFGEFKDGSFDGKGTYSDPSGVSKKGTWKNNAIQEDTPIFSKTQGKEKAKYQSTADETISFGNVSQLKEKLPDCTSQFCHQKNGIYHYRDGSEYYGFFQDGEPLGEGVCIYANGTKYQGSWASHGPHGMGTLVLSENQVISGRWEMGSIKDRIYTDEAIVGIQQANEAPKQRVDAEKTEIYAVIVGVASYNTMSSLKYTDDDAYQLYAFLKSPEGGAVKDDHIGLLIDDAATRKNIAQEMGKIFSKADENDVVLLYMSGHGLEGNFVPADFDGINNLFSYKDILTVFNTTSAKHKLMIVDACHSGSMYAAKGPDFIGLQSYYDQFSETNGGTAVIMSSKKDEVSLEYSGIRQGIFSHYLVRGLKGEANEDNNQFVTVKELFDYIYLNVRHYTNNAQTPSIAGDYDVNMPVSLIRQ